jgi:site-specific DNA-methyltransferase (adenine-specific)
MLEDKEVTGIAYNVIKHPRELKQHPLNIEIYGMEVADLDLVESIKSKGILEPIVIKEDNTILSGHRRWMAAKDLQFDKVPCRVLTFIDQADEEESLIEFNRQRQKNITQRMRESDHLKTIYEKRRGYRSDLELPLISGEVKEDKHARESSTKIAEKIGMKRDTFTKASSIWEKAKAGNETAKKLIVELDSGKKAVHTAYTEIKKEEDLTKRREVLAQKTTAAKKLPDTITLHHGNFLTDYPNLGKETVDCIITDPPYVNEWLENYGAFAMAAEYVLKPGGFLITYVGHIHLDKILAQMTPHLEYYWVAMLKHAGTNAAVHSRSVQCGMKPILIFNKAPRMKPKRYFNDVIIGTGKEKDAHEWQQGEEELRQLFEPFTDPGDTVLDPFMGSGTTIAMAKKLNRIAIGFDIDEQNVAIVKGRVIDNAI